MKIRKILMLSGIALVTALSALTAQAECAGTVVTGNNGHEYCESDLSSTNRLMNWWSAYTWCESQGRHLATIYELCPDWDGSMGGGKCSNVTSSFPYMSWTSTAHGSNGAIFVKNSGEVLGSGGFTRTYSMSALCY